MRLIGYARVSTVQQDLALQLDALKSHGCTRIFQDKISGAKQARPGFDACMKFLASGDVLLVWRLDRLGRSISHLVSLVESLRARNVGLRSICDGIIDTSSASGDLIFNIFAALAQFERRLLQERTKAGLEAARARGRVGGRRPITASDPRVKAVKKLAADKSIQVSDICSTLKISRATFYRFLAL